MTRSVVFLHPGSLGDVLLAVPAIRRLTARYSGRDTILIARDSVSQFLVACGVINDWMSWEGPAGAGLFSRGVLRPPKLETWLKRCDVAVAWMEDTEGTLGSIFREYKIAQVRIQSPSSLELRARHQSHRFLEAAGELDDEGFSEHPIQVPPYLIKAGTACLEDIGVPGGRAFVLVHPGSGSAHKCLDSESIATTIQRLEQQGLLPVVIEGPADQHAVERVLKVSSRRPPILRNLALTTLAGVFTQARGFFGHDSGVSHLAALLGVRTVVVFGPTDPDRWAPLGNQVTILRGAPCLCRSWEAVRQCHEKPCLGVPSDQILTSLGASG